MMRRSSRWLGGGLAALLGSQVMGAQIESASVSVDSLADAAASGTASAEVRVIHLHEASPELQRRYGYGERASEPKAGRPERGRLGPEQVEKTRGGYAGYVLTQGALNHTQFALVDDQGLVSQHCAAGDASDDHVHVPDGDTSAKAAASANEGED